MARHNAMFQPPTLIQRPSIPTIRPHPPPHLAKKRPKPRKSAIAFLSSLPPIPTPAPVVTVRDGMSDVTDLDSMDVSGLLHGLGISSPQERKHPLPTHAPPPTQPKLAGWDSFDTDELLADEDEMTDGQIQQHVCSPRQQTVFPNTASKHSHFDVPQSPAYGINDSEYAIADEMGTWEPF